jgi:hypothetical protein
MMDFAVSSVDTATIRAADKYLSRLQLALTVERHWKNLYDWNLIIDGRSAPKDNLFLIKRMLENYILSNYGFDYVEAFYEHLSHLTGE